MEYWDLVENPKGKVYQQLIKTMCELSDKFYFITRKELKQDVSILKQFESHVIESYKTKEWAFTITTSAPATVYVIDSNLDTCNLLLKFADSLYDWVTPLPEDLTFIKNNFIWFSCTTHNQFGRFTFRNKYYKNIILNIEGLKLEKYEDN